MTQMTMPSRHGGLDSGERCFICGGGRLQGIEPPLALPSMQNFLRGLILDQKIIRMIFNKYVIIDVRR
jgi:hypothetical protein